MPLPSPIHFFGAADPAPSATGKADDGALGVAAAWDRRSLEDRAERAPVESDFEFRVCYARLVRQSDVSIWSGLIHGLHRRFGFSNFVLDAGAGGGGRFIQKELGKHRQRIDGVEQTCVPLVSRDDVDVLDGQHIVTMVSLREPLIKEHWSGLRGDDMLKHALHVDFQSALMHGWVAAPPAPKDIPRAATVGWPEERRLAALMLDRGFQQLQRITIAAKPDGTPIFTSNGVPKFRSSGRDDLGMMLVYLWLAFSTWLKAGLADDEEGPQGGDVGFGG
jgi:hypothetical protein